MSTSTATTNLVRLAVAGGRSDRLRIVLTIAGAAATTQLLLVAAAVALISPDDGPYRLDVIDQPGLRTGVIMALLLLCAPLVVFMGLCTRVGAPARDRRLAMFRMAGATPGETTRIAAFETGVAALLGALVGVASFLAVKLLFDDTTYDTFEIVQSETASLRMYGPVRILPTDVHVPVLVYAAVAAAVTIGAVAASVLALRRIRISPFGVTRRAPTEPPTTTAAVLFVASSAGLLALGALYNLWMPSQPLFMAATSALLATCVASLLMGGASLSVAVGRLIAPRTSRADLLIASRRMIDAPYTASRASASVLLVALIGGAIAGTRANFLASQDPSDTFYADTFDLLGIVLAVALALSAANLLVTNGEAIVERRRTLAALVAVGTPRRVLARSAIMETAVPLVPTVVVASTVGLLAARTFFGTTVDRPAAFDGPRINEFVTVGVPVPWAHLIGLVCGTIAFSVLATMVSLVFMRASTRPAELRTAA